MYPGYDTMLHVMVKLSFWRSENVEYFIAITPMSTLTKSGTTC